MAAQLALHDRLRMPTPEEIERSRRHGRDLLHLLAGLTCGLAIALVLSRLGRSGEDADLERFRQVREFVRSNYARDVASRELVERSLHGMVESLDPYSRFYDHEQVAALERETTGKYTGIGVVFVQPATRGQVLFVLPNSPAQRAGLHPGDTIVEVGGRAVSAMAAGELRAMLGDPDRGDVALKLRSRAGVERETSIGKDSVVDPTVRHEHMIDAERGIGYLAITAFSQETVEEFDHAVERLRSKGLRALVIDVRGNLGGVLRAAVKIANRFVAHGLIVSHEGRGDPVRYEAEPAEAHYLGLPLTVLVDGSSASASEVFAAAVQEYRVAAIVGSPTYGKGMVQQVQSFGDDMVVKLITSYYFTPSHRNIERTLSHAWDKGLVPDLELDLADSEVDAIHAHLATYSAPASCIDEIEAWQREEHRSLLPQPPPDAQLDAALALFRGERPGAYVAQAVK
jgi:carboxyl-terminal processing protease